MLKSERQQLYHIDWSLWRQSSLKKSTLVIWKILWLLFDPLTVDDKYALLNRGNLLQHFQIQLSHKRKIFSEFSFAFSKFRFNFKHFQNKRWPSWLMYFWTYALRNTWLDKCLKSPVSEDHSRSNMVNGPKHSKNLGNCTFTIFIDHCEVNSIWKSLSEWYAKS